ncbi:general transcription factor IIH subunit 3 [Micractinium conductrix]|uniref:General transcription and DNA repair factor IIH subunit TFB4 n=1 Tax=Micractinium conductrix TaxID=554055 RepID=A0A2P6VJR4_9CHLO|nr:general transcription factor IIH subunit 3 [Micractinium conductrix]|eukprot:PSC74346.1 general transcription factor IIH subunit 3 [Micractinium conductrix]
MSTSEWEDDSSLLALLLDVSPAALARLASTPGLGLQSLLEQLLTFVNAFLLLNDANRLAVFTADAAGARLAYCSPACLPPGAAGAGDAAEATAWPPSVAVLAGLQQAATAAAGAGAGAPAATGGSCQLSAALSRALCFIQSQRRRAAAAAAGPGGGAAGGGDGATAGGAVDEMGGQGSQAARVLCLSGGTDVPSQYIAVMNAIFSAQRSGILIDACQLGPGHSAFLQQAAFLTGGVYLKPAKPQALAQYLNSVFALDARTRGMLRLPGAAHVDFRPSCFCHKRQIDLGFVCSACLSIFCEQLPACTTCGTDFQGKVKQ